MNFNTIFAIAFLIIILLVIIKIFMGPLKILVKLVYSSILGTFAILIFNFLGKFIGLHIGLNLVTILTIAFLGLPGMALILFLQIIFKV